MESAAKPRLREQVRTVMRLHHYSILLLVLVLEPQLHTL